MPDLTIALADFLNSSYTQERHSIDPMQKRMMDSTLLQWLLDNKVLIPSQAMNEQVTCPGCEQQCTMEVETIRQQDGTLAYAIACDKRDDIGMVRLEQHEVQPVIMDIEGFCTVLAIALTSVDTIRVSIPDRLYRLGRSTIEGTGYTFFFAPTLADERTIASHPDYMNAHNPVVLVATKPKEPSLMVVALESLFTMQDAQLRLFPAALTGLYDGNVTPEQNIFRKEGDIWNIAYQGKQTRLKHTKGCTYVHHLLGNPQQFYTCSKLQALEDKPLLANENYSTMSVEELENEDLSVLTDDGNDVLDERTLETFRDNLKTLDTKIKEAEKQGAGAALNRLKQNKADIKEYLKKNTNIKGKSRKTGKESEKARLAVHHTIATARKNLDKELPALGNHLKVCLKTGHTCSYQPEQMIYWQV